jgi:ADP-heptose:LPS heptosyltransferase
MAFVQRRAVCHVGIDSGPAHCAAAVGCPSIVFWGWTGVGVCSPERFAINVVPHYPSVCPILGACYGNVHCGVDPSKPESAFRAPCVASLDPAIAVQLLSEALSAETPEEARSRLVERSQTAKVLYRIPAPPAAPVGS